MAVVLTSTGIIPGSTVAQSWQSNARRPLVVYCAPMTFATIVVLASDRDVANVKSNARARMRSCVAASSSRAASWRRRIAAAARRSYSCPPALLRAVRLFARYLCPSPRVAVDLWPGLRSAQLRYDRTALLFGSSAGLSALFARRVFGPWHLLRLPGTAPNSHVGPSRVPIFALTICLSLKPLHSQVGRQEKDPDFWSGSSLARGGTKGD
jgi:hypothetical protein